MAVVAVAAACSIWPISAGAQAKKAATPPPGSERQTPKPKGGPFRGKLVSLDKTARTITVGKRTFHAGPNTRIERDGKPARFEDGVVGEITSGGFKLDDQGRMMATKINYGPKVDARATQKAPSAPVSSAKKTAP